MFSFISQAVDAVNGVINAELESTDPGTSNILTSNTFPPANLTANLVSAETKTDKKSGTEYHVYVINVKFGHRSWCVERRYKVFHHFHSLHVGTLRDAPPVDVQSALYQQRTGTGSNVSSYPELPPKKICGNREDDFVAQRLEHLTHYCQGVMRNPNLRRARSTREFLTAAEPERMARLYNEYIPLLVGGGRFKKIGAVFTRDIRFRLLEDATAFEYWTPVDGLHGKGEDVKQLRVHTISNVSPTDNGLIITAERECELDMSLHSRSKFVRTAWLNALTELVELMHLVRADDDDINAREKSKKQIQLRDSTNTRARNARSKKRASIREKYANTNNT